MKIKISIYAASFILCYLCLNCGRIKKTDAEVERENWIAGFTDSIEYYQTRTTEIEHRLKDVNAKIQGMLQDFEMVKKPREVSGYYLLKGWETQLPLTTTGVYARINENEKLELIATLAGSTFNQLGIDDGNNELKTEVTPHDQAFNFRHDRFNTVYFCSGKTDTLTDYIASHRNDNIKLQFLEGKVKKNFIIPEKEKVMISKTWDLFSAQKEARQLQKEIWINSKKIDTFRRMMDSSLNNQNI